MWKRKLFYLAFWAWEKTIACLRIIKMKMKWSEYYFIQVLCIVKVSYCLLPCCFRSKIVKKGFFKEDRNLMKRQVKDWHTKKKTFGFHLEQSIWYMRSQFEEDQHYIHLWIYYTVFVELIRIEVIRYRYRWW